MSAEGGTGVVATVLASVPVRVAALALLATIAYGGALAAGVAWDDAAVLSANPAIRSLARPWRFFTDAWTINPSGGAMLAQYRPLRTLAYALQFAIFGGNAWGYHLVSLLLHGLCAWAVARLTQRLFGRGAWLAAALWLLHPAISENALYLAAQGNLLCLLGAVLAIVWHLEWLDGGGWKVRAGSLAAAAFSMFSYEFGATLVVLVPIVEVIRHERGGAMRPGVLARHAPLWAVLVAYLGVRAAAVQSFPSEPWWGGSWLASVGIELRAWMEGWRLTLFPIHQLVRYEVADLPSWAPLGLAVAFHVALAVLVVMAIRGRVSRTLAAAIVWWYAAQAPTANVFTPNLGYVFAPRFLFVALVLPVAAAAAWLEAQATRRRWVTWAIALVLLLFIPLDRAQTAVWQSWRSVFTSLVEHRSDDFTARVNLANSFAKSGEPRRAVAEYEIAHRLDPSYAPVTYALGELYLELGEHARAREMLADTLAKNPHHVWARVGMAELDIAAGAQARAWVDPVRELKGWPPYARARVEIALAGVDARLGECGEVRRRVQVALDRWTDTSDIVGGAGRLLMRCGERAEGLELRRRAADLARTELVDMVGDSAWLDY